MRGGTEKTTQCGSCGGALLGEAIKVAANLHYHVQCFLCTACGCELVNTGFFSKLTKYYCAEDYHSLFGTLCTLCSKYIEGEGLSVQGKGKSYHISCLTCSRCNARFDEGSRITFEKDQALCDTCKVTSVSKATKHTCAGCNETIVGTSIFAMEQEWHMTCFNCQECKKPLTGEYMCKEGVPYCEEDYQSLFGQCCNICSEFILGKVLQAGGNSYHTSCLKCYICTQQFEEGQEIFMQDELFWHTDCDETAPQALEDDEDVREKDPPALVLPPPPTSTSPDTPETEHRTDKLLDQQQESHHSNLGVTPSKDISKSSTSIASDYEDLRIPQESGKSVVYESDFDEQAAKPIKPDRASSVKSAASAKSAKSGGSARSDKSIDQPLKSISMTSESSLSPAAKPRSQTIESGHVSEEKAGVFTDVSEPIVLPHNGKHSDSSSYLFDKENLEEEERQPSVKEIMRLAKEKEQANSAPKRKTDRQDFVTSKKYLSTDSDMSDRGSEASDAPTKPPRTKSPVRNHLSQKGSPRESPLREQAPENDDLHKAVITDQARNSIQLNRGAVDNSPNATVRGLRSVDSPIMKLLDDLDNKPEEQIDYLEVKEYYDLCDLQTQKYRLPKGIDRSQLQQYLAPEKFQDVFKMPIDKFDKLPLWKKTNLKKSAKLF